MKITAITEYGSGYFLLTETLFEIGFVLFQKVNESCIAMQL